MVKARRPYARASQRSSTPLATKRKKVAESREQPNADGLMVTINGGNSRGKTSPAAWIPDRVTEGNTHWEKILSAAPQ
jgi:hypothetical protein